MTHSPKLSAFRGALRDRLADFEWWSSPDGSPPSFLAYYSRHRRVYFDALEATDRSWVWSWETKDGGKALADAVGLHTPATLFGPGPVSHIEWDRLPERFVIKPSHATNSAGVFVLSSGPQGYFDHLRRQVVTARDVLDELERLRVEGGIRGSEVLVEDAVLNPSGDPSFDWKCYAFQGEVVLIMQVARGPGGKRYKYYDPNFKELGRVRWKTPAEASLSIPFFKTELVAAAASISQAVPVPFVRVDLFEGSAGAVFGELTPTPGLPQRFTRPLDLRMGDAWERAEARLLAGGCQV